MNVGYNSSDPAQIKRQINDVISRGIDGVVMVWYGPNNAIKWAAQLVMHEAKRTLASPSRFDSTTVDELK